jgi:threonyl-tRNA synthetase
MSQLRLTLPDGSVRELPQGSTGHDVARAIGPGLAKAALAIRVDGALRDLAQPIESDAAVSIVTDRDPAALDLLRH